MFHRITVVGSILGSNVEVKASFTSSSHPLWVNRGCPKKEVKLKPPLETFKLFETTTPGPAEQSISKEKQYLAPFG